MKWDDSILDANGGRLRYAYRQAETTSYTLTDYNGRRVTVRESGADTPVLAEATPSHKGRTWVVKISTPGHKYGFATGCTKDQAINIMLHRRAEFQGRKMFL
jgi:hypothetical protein